MKCKALLHSLRYATLHAATNRWAKLPQKYYNNRSGMIQQRRGPEADGILPGIKSPAEGQDTLEQWQMSSPSLPLAGFYFGW